MPEVWSLEARLQRCDREIASALSFSVKRLTPYEHLGVLLWEMDWRVERERILEELEAKCEL